MKDVIITVVNQSIKDSIDYQASVIFVNLKVTEDLVTINISDNRNIEEGVTSFPVLDEAVKKIEQKGGEMEYIVNPEFGLSIEIKIPIALKKWLLSPAMIKKSADLLESDNNCEISFNIDLFGRKYYFHKSDFTNKKGELERHMQNILSK